MRIHSSAPRLSSLALGISFLSCQPSRRCSSRAKRRHSRRAVLWSISQSVSLLKEKKSAGTRHRKDQFLAVKIPVRGVSDDILRTRGVIWTSEAFPIYAGLHSRREGRLGKRTPCRSWRSQMTLSVRSQRLSIRQKYPGDPRTFCGFKSQTRQPGRKQRHDGPWPVSPTAEPGTTSWVTLVDLPPIY